MRHPRSRVLLVDCIPDDQRMYAEFLELAGFDPVVTCEASAVFEHATAGPADVIVIDTGYAATNGLELIERLRSDHRTRDAGIIVISGHVFPRDRAAAKKAGCDVFLPKPCLPETLLTEVRRLSDIENP
jgi:two-component system, cell cycle response regulator DivK